MFVSADILFQLSVTGGRLLYTGKVTTADRSVAGGFTIGKAVIEPSEEVPFPSEMTKTESRTLVLKFQV